MRGGATKLTKKSRKLKKEYTSIIKKREGTNEAKVSGSKLIQSSVANRRLRATFDRRNLFRALRGNLSSAVRTTLRIRAKFEILAGSWPPPICYTRRSECQVTQWRSNSFKALSAIFNLYLRKGQLSNLFFFVLLQVELEVNPSLCQELIIIN